MSILMMGYWFNLVFNDCNDIADYGIVVSILKNYGIFDDYIEREACVTCSDLKMVICNGVGLG